MKQFTIILTGGGTAGHVTPNLALIEVLKQEGWSIEYIGSHQGIEKSLIEKANIPYHPISTGKLRRYFSWENFLDPFRILKGIWEAFWLLRHIKPNVVFSKGGFVAFPVVLAAWLNGIPAFAHESDRTPGLANRLSFPFVQKLFVTFAPDNMNPKWQGKMIETGLPIRQALFQGERDRGLALCHFNTDKPCLLIMGGSQGAGAINALIRNTLPELQKKYQIIHICGSGKTDSALTDQVGYAQFEYVNEELTHLLAASDIVISRAGSNSLYELLALQKPHLLVPLPLTRSRGDQIHNAQYFEKKGVSVVLQEADLTPDSLLQALVLLEHKKPIILDRIKTLDIQPAAVKITTFIKEYMDAESPAII